MSDVGNSGYSWASAINDIKGVYLSFNTIGLIPNYTTDRAHGFQLRCLSE
ncbi:hypothetical protein [uncultured Rikenella sp.]|nr:hypothetical protein [uncultured Rikenella sp.]